ncbi:MAG: dephospho-CoA kinase [Candidatus Omnitrophica bacterium]|nr:dephospho-CoA kinase [Candidatus Omnitrophota bacterium]
MPKKLKRTLIVGVTGQLATGKSTVAAMFAERGAAVINADLLAHRALRPHGACFKKVVRAFGKDILKKGEIDRKGLAEIVFSDEKKLKKLEGIIHPFVIKETRRQAELFKKSGKSIVVLDVPLLFESKMDKGTDLSVVVKASRAVQLKRIAQQRRMEQWEALRRMRAQFSMAEKARRADIIVNNGGTLERTEKQVTKIWEMLQRRY